MSQELLTPFWRELNNFLRCRLPATLSISLLKRLLHVLLCPLRDDCLADIPEEVTVRKAPKIHFLCRKITLQLTMMLNLWINMLDSIFRIMLRNLGKSDFFLFESELFTRENLL